MEKLTNFIVFFLFTYPAGVLIGIAFWLLRLFGVLKVKGWRNFPHWHKRVIVISNHPSLVEPILLVGLFFHQYLFRPLIYGPWTFADKKNYYNKYPLLRPRLIPVNRTGKNGNLESLLVAKQILKSGGIIIMFPEGGRTFKGTSFLTSARGKKIRPLKEGFAYLALETSAVLLPLWFQGNFWSGMSLTIGEPTAFTSGTPRDEVLERTEKVLLDLADQTD